MQISNVQRQANFMPVIYGLKVMKSEFKKARTLQLTGIRRIDGEL